jgi:diguanylate cyclase (GGDEF)-like protein
VQVVFRPLPAVPPDTAAMPDQLTELPSRRQFRGYLQGAIDRAIRNRHLLWVLYVDLDRFSAVNAAQGHAAGDRVLAEAAARLQRCIRRTDFLASAGGDEFLIALEGTTDLEGARVVAQRSLQSLAEPFDVGDVQVRTSACIGISAGPLDGGTPDALLRNVDVAVFQAKAAGRGRLEFYSTAMDDQQRRSALAHEETGRKLASLTPREQEVLARLVAGEANKMIAYMLGTSMRTIEHHRARIMDKMGAGSLPELVRMVIGRHDP